MFDQGTVGEDGVLRPPPMTTPPLDVSKLHHTLADDLRARFRRRGVPAQDVDDLVQDVFLRVHRARDALRAGERFDAWLARVANSVLVDASRRGRRVPAPADELEPEARDEEPRLEAVAATWLPGTIDALPPIYAEVLRLADLEHVPHKQIAKRLGIGVSAVKSRVSRGRAMLRDAIDACCTFERDRRGGLVDYARRQETDCACDGVNESRGTRKTHRARK